jgi:hypothetical protein
MGRGGRVPSVAANWFRFSRQPFSRPTSRRMSRDTTSAGRRKRGRPAAPSDGEAGAKRGRPATAPADGQARARTRSQTGANAAAADEPTAAGGGRRPRTRSQALADGPELKTRNIGGGGGAAEIGAGPAWHECPVSREVAALPREIRGLILTYDPSARRWASGRFLAILSVLRRRGGESEPGGTLPPAPGSHSTAAADAGGGGGGWHGENNPSCARAELVAEGLRRLDSLWKTFELSPGELAAAASRRFNPGASGRFFFLGLSPPEPAVAEWLCAKLCLAPALPKPPGARADADLSLVQRRREFAESLRLLLERPRRPRRSDPRGAGRGSSASGTKASTVRRPGPDAPRDPRPFPFRKGQSSTISGS